MHLSFSCIKIYSLHFYVDAWYINWQMLVARLLVSASSNRQPTWNGVVAMVICGKRCRWRNSPLNRWCLWHQQSADKLLQWPDITLAPKLDSAYRLPPFIIAWCEGVISDLWLPWWCRFLNIFITFGTTNLGVTFSCDAPLSRAGAWNCL